MIIVSGQIARITSYAPREGQDRPSTLLQLLDMGQDLSGYVQDNLPAGVTEGSWVRCEARFSATIRDGRANLQTRFSKVQPIQQPPAAPAR